MRKIEACSTGNIYVSKVFGEDKKYGKLYIGKEGGVYCEINSTVFRFELETGGRNGKELMFRWVDKASGKQKKAYIKKLIQDNFG